MDINASLVAKRTKDREFLLCFVRNANYSTNLLSLALIGEVKAISASHQSYLNDSIASVKARTLVIVSGSDVIFAGVCLSTNNTIARPFDGVLKAEIKVLTAFL